MEEDIEMKIYKLRDKNTGLYMTGHGRYPLFNEYGQSYETTSAAKRATKTRNLWHRRDEPGYDLEIVEFELVPTGYIEDVA